MQVKLPKNVLASFIHNDHISASKDLQANMALRICSKIWHVFMAK